MGKLRTNGTVPLLLGIAAASALLFVLAFDRYTYHDYHEAYCTARDAKLRARLTGSYIPLAPHTRSSPYTLTIELSGVEFDYAVADVLLVPGAHGKGMRVTDLQQIDRDAPEGTAAPFWLLAENLPLDYQDQELSGKILGSSAGGTPIAFSCLFKKDPHREWRASWLDAFMSV